jgi:hypothetical protein
MNLEREERGARAKSWMEADTRRERECKENELKK